MPLPSNSGTWLMTSDNLHFKFLDKPLDYGSQTHTSSIPLVSALSLKQGFGANVCGHVRGLKIPRRSKNAEKFVVELVYSCCFMVSRPRLTRLHHNSQEFVPVKHGSDFCAILHQLLHTFISSSELKLFFQWRASNIPRGTFSYKYNYEYTTRTAIYIIA